MITCNRLHFLSNCKVISNHEFLQLQVCAEVNRVSPNLCTSIQSDLGQLFTIHLIVNALFCIMQLLHLSLGKFSIRHTDNIFLTFQRKLVLTFHANCLLMGQFA